MRRILLGALGLSVAGVVGLGILLRRGTEESDNVFLVAGLAVPFTVLGALVLLSTSGRRVGRLMVATGLTAAVELVALAWTDVTALAWVAQWLWFPMLGLVFLTVLVFPTGTLPSRRWRPVAAVLVGGTLVTALLMAAAAIGEPRIYTDGVTEREPWVQTLHVASKATGLVAAVAYLGAVGSLVRRWRQATPGSELRRQLACLVPGGLLLVFGLVLTSSNLSGAWALVVVGIPAGMAAAILRHRLFDIDLLVNRAIVWLVLTALVLVSVAAVVTLLSDVLAWVAEETSLILATGMVVVTFEPVHQRVQHSVDHLLYGDRDDPYRVIARLGDLLRRTVNPAAVMPLVTQTVVESLQVPYAAMELADEDGRVVVAEHGRKVPATECFEMVAHGERVGRLVVGRRTLTAPFSRQECRLLQDIAVQAGIAAEATQLNRDLQASRERLVAGREEERRRLRRDLHDGLGPGLAGLTMQVREAQRERDPQRVERLLSGVLDDLQLCREDLRRLVDQLRPAVLDRGLEAALRGEAQRFSSGPLTVSLHMPGDLGGLPAAVEVAAFRIVAEAVTNVARHSRAHTCRITASRGHRLRITITDDGAGLPATVRAGVGLASMRERAAELGGRLTVEPASGQGTMVTLELPLPADGGTEASRARAEQAPRSVTPVG